MNLTLLTKVQRIGIRQSLVKFLRYLRGLYYRRYFEQCGFLQVTGKLHIFKRNAQIQIGKCLLWKNVKIDMEGPDPQHPAFLGIGNFTTIGDRTEIHVAQNVSIGNYVRIAWDCVIMDRNYHGIGSAPEIIKPVAIHDHVWIGCRVIILPGVSIGEGSIVAAGSVVTKNIPPFVLVAGNPATVVKGLNEPTQHSTSN